MPAWAKAAADLWTSAAENTSGRVLRALSQKREVKDGLTAQAIYLIVRDYAREIGMELAPHDLRRTFATLSHRGRSPIEQIRFSLGHEPILTTERYLGVRQNLTDAP